MDETSTIVNFDCGLKLLDNSYDKSLTAHLIE